MNPARFLIPSALLIIGVLLFSLIATDAGDPIRLIDSSVKTDDNGTRYVSAVLENATDGTFHHATVEVMLLDASGAVLSRSQAERSTFEAGALWAVIAPVTPGATRYRIGNLRCTLTPEASDEQNGACALTHEGDID